jgi:membrane-bound ClpP family serine protease
MLGWIENFRSARLVPSWLSVPLMMLGVVFLLVEGWTVGPLVLVPIGIAAVIGAIEHRRIRKVTVLERSADHVVWRVDYRSKDAVDDR